MLFNVPRLGELWEHIEKIDFGKIKLPQGERPGDQAILRYTEDAFPELAGTVPREWDISAADGCISCNGHNFRKAKSEDEILLDIPAAGMLHLNGGLESGEAYFKVHKLMKYNHTFGLVHYYSDMPWDWAKYIVESKRREHVDYNVLVKAD